MRIDYLTILGLILGVSAILIGQHLEGGALSTLINGPAALIVIGGTLGAVMLQSPIQVFIRAIKMLWWTIFTPQFDSSAVMQKIISWSNIARREGLLGLENLEEAETDLFAKKGYSYSLMEVSQIAFVQSWKLIFIQEKTLIYMLHVFLKVWVVIVQPLVLLVRF